MATTKEKAEKREAHASKTQAQLEAWKKRLEDITHKMEASSPPEAYRQRIEGLKAKHTAVESRFNAFRRPGTEPWSTFRAAVINDWTELLIAMREIRQAAAP